MKGQGCPSGPEGRSGGRSEARSAERRPERRPEGTACCPRGFQNPRTGDGDLQVKIPEQKPEFYIYFCIFKQTSHYNLYTNQLNFGHTNFTIPHSLSRVIHIFNSFLHTPKIISLDLSTQTLLFNHLIMNNFQTRFMSKPLEIKHFIIF